MGWGSMVYTNTLPAIANPSTLYINDCHDYAQIFINNKYIGSIDRVKNEKSIAIPAVNEGDKLTIVIEAMGRINFGRAIKDYKGITKDVTIDTNNGNHLLTYTLKGWQTAKIPDDCNTAEKALNKISQHATDNVMGNRGYYRGYFNLKKVGDTFLDMETWGKGQVYVNGHALGRFWSIGPQQTLYLPGCWLKKGKNEIIVLDVVGPKQPVVWGQDKPELNKLQMEKTNKHNAPGDRPDLNSANPVAQGNMNVGNGWQTVKFDTPAKGRYIAIQCNSTQTSDDVLAIAELYALDADGNRISREPWTVKYADSENENGNHLGDKAFDLQESTYWQTVKGTALPHLLVIDLGSKQTITGIQQLPRAEKDAPGAMKQYKIYIY